MATITISTDALTNDQVGQLVAILSLAADNAADMAQRAGDTEAAEAWDRDLHSYAEAAGAAFSVLCERMDTEEAMSICDDFGAIPEFVG